MNNQEHIKDVESVLGHEQRPDDNGFIQPAGLSLPTQSYDSYAEHLEDEKRLLADWDKHQGQPSVANNPDPYLSQSYVDDWEQPVQELQEGSLPSLPTIHNQRRLS